MVYDPPSLDDKFYKWMGLCISRWSYTEDILFGLTQIVLGIPKELVAIIYYRTPSLESRLALVKELVTATLPQPERKSGAHKHALEARLEAVLKEIRDLIPARNALAHHQIKTRRAIPIYDEAGRLANEPRFLTVEASENERARGRKMHEPIKLQDMKAHYEAVEAARFSLFKFQAALLVWRQQERLRQARKNRSAPNPENGRGT